LLGEGGLVDWGQTRSQRKRKKKGGPKHKKNGEKPDREQQKNDAREKRWGSTQVQAKRGKQTKTVWRKEIGWENE